MELGEPKVKKSKHSILSEHLCEPSFEETFCKHWHNNTYTKNNNLEVLAKPFRVCKISNFIENEEIMDEIKNELLDVKTRRNSIDLYQFEQSNEISTVNSQYLKLLYETFQTEMVAWMRKNTNIELNGHVSMSSACYTDTDFLLCHDDNLEDRRIAFILYLSKSWTEEDGGALDLIDTDENGLPRNVVKSLIPEYNSLVFFEVVHNSYHQVAEVTSDKSRWSINGWFHGPLPQIEKPLRSKILTKYFEPVNSEIDLELWISSLYLHQKIIKGINEELEKDSWVFLEGFLLSDVYKKLSLDIQSENIKWKRVGPADIRNYEVAEEGSLPKDLADFCKLFKSLSIFGLLKKYTELDLVPEREDMHPRMTVELQRWSRGCYTLIHDETTLVEAVIDKSDSKNCDSNVAKEDSSTNFTNVLRLEKNDDEESGSSGIRVNEPTPDSNTPPSSHDEHEFDEEDDSTKYGFKGKSKMKIDKKVHDSPSKVNAVRKRRTWTSDGDVDDGYNYGSDSEESDIGDYLSDHEEDEENLEDAEEVQDELPGSLDLIIQFNTDQTLDDESIDYIDLNQEDSALIHVPAKDNFLCLVYKTSDVSRTRKYVSHYCEGYYYTLICNYCE